ncbi:integrin alpha-E isoform X2 [Neoarius graeffei]|uniref:integrin alpha-E isoform X2 n=1 Tax=Neoarius graeffei TaxID=443677 RepID=UPI00298CA2B1|nr:integrin alpha-E isoform X2 [Neoarius graeffei]
MFAAVLIITGIYTAVGFNIYTTPVNNFTNEDLLFGQTLIQSTDGCTEKSCSRMDAIVTGGMKGLSPIVSVASCLTEQKEQLLVCNQVRTRNSSAEYFNGNCTNISDKQEKSKIYPDKLVLQLLEQNNNNNNNNIHQSNQKSPNQDHWRKRRAVQNDDDEDEDAGTEISFVLDGSGSINEEDFERAKDFIYNVMKNVWTTCFICNFAIVQYGRNITTELSLQENEDGVRALNKVKNITQIHEITKTASALYHVLTDVFVPENGSKKNAKKMIILLSDGQMLGDTRNLTDVLNMPQMEGIVRYAIGVGPEVLNRQKAMEEMMEIAGSNDRFFNASDYAALEKIISSLEEKIIGIEGIQKGAGFELQLAEAGFSSHFIHDGSMLFGTVGAYDWSGGIILLKNKKPVAFFNATKEEPRFSYLGYSVASAYMDSKTLYISGAPRYNLTGAVFIFDGTNQDLLQGDQVGSYFGSVLCALDINNDKYTDYLLVGAPHFHVKGEEGKVLVYKLNKGQFEKEASELHGLQKDIYARFGSAIANIGDIDGNQYNDVAVGAPLEADSEGSVYIYNGFKDGLKKKFSQRITPSDFGRKLVYFGQAVSVMSFLGTNKTPLISVGSEGTITVFKTIPVIIIEPKITLDVEVIKSERQTNDKSSTFHTNLQICFNTPKGEIKSGELPIEYYIDLDSDKEQKRLVHYLPDKARVNFTLTNSQTCTDRIILKYEGCSDCFSPIKIRVNFTLSPSTGLPMRVLDPHSPNEAIKEIVFEKDCNGQHCKANISLVDSRLSKDILIIGFHQTLDIKFNLMNFGNNSYITTLTLRYPEILSFKKSGGEKCEDNNNHQIVCKILHPIFKRKEQTSVTIAWQLIDGNTNNSASITALLTGGNNGSDKLDSKTYNFTVRKALAVQLTGTAKPNRLNITEGEQSPEQLLDFTFKLLGENKYKAKINVTITLTKQTYKTSIIIESVEPKNCSRPSDGHVNSTYQIVCILTDLHDIKIKARTHIHDIQDKTEKIIAEGEFTFDESIYVGNKMKQRVEVSLIKLTVVKSTALIVGSSIGGFLLLIVIIIILIKCGFFRRRHKLDRTPSTN